MGKCFPDFDMANINQAYIRFRHYSDTGFPRVMANEWTTEYFRFWRCQKPCWILIIGRLAKRKVSIFKEIYEKELDQISMLDEMRLTLDFLKEKNIPMGVITNGPTEHQLKKLRS